MGSNQKGKEPVANKVITFVVDTLEQELDSVLAAAINELHSLGHNIKEIRVMDDSGETKVPTNTVPGVTVHEPVPQVTVPAVETPEPVPAEPPAIPPAAEEPPAEVPPADPTAPPVDVPSTPSA